MYRSFAVGMLLFLAACGGGGTTPPPSATVARVSLEQSSVLVTGIGSTQTISAKAYDASGAVLSVPVTFESSKPAVATVNASGVVTGVAVGSSQLTATAGGVKSTPIIAAVATLTADTANIAENNIVSGPTFTNLAEGELPSIGTRYTAVVQNLTPAVGRKWFSQGKNGLRLQGKIIEVADAPGGKLVTLEVVPYEEIFSQLSIDEELDFSKVTDTVPTGFEPQRVGSQAFVNINSVMECELSNVGAAPPFTFGVPSMSIGLNVDESRTGIRINVGFGQDTVVVVRFRAGLNATLNMSGTINRNFSGTADCRTRNPILRTIGGIPLPMFTGLVSERGLGVKFSGDFSGPSTSYTATGSLGVSVDIGANINFSQGTVSTFNTVTPTVSGILNLTQPNAITTFDATAEAYVFDNWILTAGSVSADIWIDRTGVRSDSRMISVAQQITSGQRTTQRLDRVSFNGPGAGFARFLRMFSLRELFPPSATSTVNIRTAPFALQSFACNALSGSTTRALCITSFSERSFPGLPNNIQKVEVWARRGTAAPFRVAEDTGVTNAIVTTTTDTATTLQAGDQCFLVVYPKSLIFAGVVAGNANSCMTAD